MKGRDMHEDEHEMDQYYVVHVDREVQIGHEEMSCSLFQRMELDSRIKKKKKQTNRCKSKVNQHWDVVGIKKDIGRFYQSSKTSRKEKKQKQTEMRSKGVSYSAMKSMDWVIRRDCAYRRR